MSNESLVTWTNFIQDAPEPLFSSPPPPVPPLPTESQLNIALGRLRQAQTPSRAADSRLIRTGRVKQVKMDHEHRVDTEERNLLVEAATELHYVLMVDRWASDKQRRKKSVKAVDRMARSYHDASKVMKSFFEVVF
ncbi:hypothetical protein FGSG_13914 [Fusarium graminearum PH-1]|uniref:hypothetical protein n=1 Tax=Gibberella zeae (strain ATCC MYA-4620 / CBS 123657 / FGSC 9075 / NRRL 31084 / PH-1) TaxID=229533 RepID=UPI00021F2613|nr:hypothetical protein FGSG_13914 [Fusarium graminearum PH-1]ESU17962.1 hypothetical protein FGSG_13914 [Fusarium graminearum PH-1]|eukprot:XP_011325584.1 hypothetical protein FGSG_13914 [Fusarium graminearum PH-1]